MKPKVSIVVPVYNVADYLPEALDSLINQTLKDIEIICIDDCSTDNSLSILKEYAHKDKRIKVIEQHENRGEVVAKYTGALCASADYIGTLDPDDYLAPNFYEIMYNKAISDNYDVVVCNIYKIDEEGNAINSILSPYRKSDGKEIVNNIDMLWYANPATINKIIKKDLIISALNFTERDCWKDAYQYWRCYTTRKVHGIFIDENLYFYRIRHDSITHTETTSEFEYVTFLKTVDLIIKFLVENGSYNTYEDILNKYISRNVKYYKCLNELYKEKDFKKIMLKHNIRPFKLNYQKYTIIDHIFSIKNSYDKKHKIISFLGFKISFRLK